jgi:2-polyprenyl-3-methyl-5-hydroxy-6-metoxy-1,4-benzoquinol methylase
MPSDSVRYAPDLTDDFTSHARVAKLVGADKLVLDIGCGGGFLAERLAARGCQVTGVDNDEVLLKRAQTVCREVLRHDLDAVDSMDVSARFDVVVMADILEHLRVPEKVLAQARSWLRPGGFAVISIPNVAHVSVRLKLLLGRFDYGPTGILDRTHLRFFTRRTFTSLLAEAGYEISDFIPIGRFPLIARFEHRLWLRRLETVAAAAWPAGFAFQFVMRAKPR